MAIIRGQFADLLGPGLSKAFYETEYNSFYYETRSGIYDFERRQFIPDEEIMNDQMKNWGIRDHIYVPYGYGHLIWVKKYEDPIEYDEDGFPLPEGIIIRPTSQIIKPKRKKLWWGVDMYDGVIRDKYVQWYEGYTEKWTYDDVYPGKIITYDPNAPMQGRHFTTMMADCLLEPYTATKALADQEAAKKIFEEHAKNLKKVADAYLEAVAWNILNGNFQFPYKKAEEQKITVRHNVTIAGDWRGWIGVDPAE